MVTLTRTLQGRLEAFNTKSQLPDDLRLLLKFIDGKRNLHDMQNALKNNICTQSNLLQLVSMGLVQDAADLRSSAASPETHHVAYLPTLPAALSPLGQQQAQPSPANDVRYDKPTQMQVDLLAQIKTSMETFLLTHAPQVAFDLLGEIENISDLGQLRASLSAYEQMIKSTGHIGKKHCLQLHALLEEDVAP